VTPPRAPALAASTSRRDPTARRQSILAAAERVFVTKGFEAATMEQVAEEAALAKGTLYLYFTSKEDLFLGLALRHQDELVRRYGAAAADAESGIDLLERLFVAYFALARERLEFFRLSLGLWLGTRGSCGQASGCRKEHVGQRRRVYNMILRAVERGAADGSVRADMAPKTLALELWAAMLGGLVLELQRASLPHDLALASGDARAVGSLTRLLVDAARTPLRPVAAPRRAPRPRTPALALGGAP
jgi:AcrR family transcriptional regulator